MARAYANPDMPELDRDPPAGEWQALRGELVALLDRVEGRYAQEENDPELYGLNRRVRSLREQVIGPEPAVLRRAALCTVKKAVDRFSERDEAAFDDEQNELTSAIAEIRGRQIEDGTEAGEHQGADTPELHDLTELVGGLNERLARLETELKSQRADGNNTREVAAQVEQLTHVVELLAGAVGETGQVKRLEAQIGALVALVEDAPKVDLSAINKRLDDVSTTVGKLAELQAQQMEREIARHETAVDGANALAPTMQAIEASVRNVYDRIDVIERNTALSAGDVERLAAELAVFTQTLKASEATPALLVAKVDALAARIGDFDTSNSDVAGLKRDIASLRGAVISGMEPRFLRIENQIEALSDSMPDPVDTSAVEHQLKALMKRMDEAGNQLNALMRLHDKKDDQAKMEAMATMVAERTSDAMTRKAPAPIAMFAPDSLKTVEERLTGLIRSASKGPDFDVLADLVAERTSAAVSRAIPAPAASVSDDSLAAMEGRMTTVLNATGKDTSERLARLEAVLTAHKKEGVGSSEPVSSVRSTSRTVEAPPPEPARSVPSGTRKAEESDIMPANPADEAPLIDPGFPPPMASVPDVVRAARPQPAAVRPAEKSDRPDFDPAMVERPSRPQSSLDSVVHDPLASQPSATVKADVGPTVSSTSTFVAAARRAQRARQEAAIPLETSASNSIISRALSRVMQSSAGGTTGTGNAETAKAEKPERPARLRKQKAGKAGRPAPVFEMDAEGDDVAVPGRQSFLVQHRRPLLLSAALVVVSLLALNLVMQRMNQPANVDYTDDISVPAIEPDFDEPSVGQVSSDAVSLVAPEPRVIDMIDTTTTAAIGPRPEMSFIRPVTVPDALVARLDMEDAAVERPALMPRTFELPAEGIGPFELRQAAADGDARAQFEVGAIYTEGRAVTQDYAEAAKWYERSAAQGFVPAQYRLGNLYEAGQGVGKDMEVARLWYQRAAEAGNRMAMHNLAALHAGGQLGEQEFEIAAQWFSQAAERGMTDSQFNLGMLYARGLGVEQDFEKSYKWFSLAARSGDGDASKARSDIGKSLSAAAVSRINAELVRWKAQPVELAVNYAPLGTWSENFDPGETITSRDVVVKVQIALNRLGFDVGTSDGIVGPKTTEAIKAFERGTGMSERGAVNPRLLAVLGSQPV